MTTVMIAVGQEGWGRDQRPGDQARRRCSLFGGPHHILSRVVGLESRTPGRIRGRAIRM
jgi:hypothetical protein